MTTFTRRALTFFGAGEQLLGIVSLPERARPRGMLIAVGGPQYRVGSHRQFTLLADYLARHGTATMRFDYAGTGDSTGKTKDFEQVAPDLRAAIDALFAAVPALQDVVIWGLCDAASAALFYAHQDPRVSGIVVLNPWVRTHQGQAQAYLKHYYLERLLSPALWRKLRRGEFDFRGSVASLAQNLHRALGEKLGAKPRATTTNAATAATPAAETVPQALPLPARMADGLERFNGRVLLILSGNDLIAREFVDVSGSSQHWRKLLAAPRVSRYTLPGATHTFSRREWRDQVAAWTSQWLDTW